MNVSTRRMDSLSISMKGQLLNEGVKICLTNIYGSNLDGDRGNFWLELEDVKVWSSGLWCIGDEFNVVRYPLEKKGRERYTRGMEDFSDFIERNSLIDYSLISGRFTWSNG